VTFINGIRAGFKMSHSVHYKFGRMGMLIIGNVMFKWGRRRRRKGGDGSDSAFITERRKNSLRFFFFPFSP
jgi:hypothetical protein